MVHLVDIYSRQKCPTTLLSVTINCKYICIYIYKELYFVVMNSYHTKRGGEKNMISAWISVISFSDIWVTFVEEMLFWVFFFIFKKKFCSWAVSEPSLQNLVWFLVWLSLTAMSSTWHLKRHFSGTEFSLFSHCEVKFKCWHSLQMKQNKWFL